MKNSKRQISGIVFFVIAFCITTTAQTNVSGFISVNTTWDLSGSPYIIVSNALLSHGYTLTIEPGVIVKFNTDKALQIDGELIAIGTAQNRITFTSSQSNPAAGDWAKIHFPDTCVNAVFDTSGNYVSGSIMKYCDVLYGGGLGFGSIHIESSSPYFNNCRILNSSSSGIYSYLSHFWIDSSSVKNCSEAGIYNEYYVLQQQNIYIRYDTIESNSGGGIYLGEGGGPLSYTISITNCYFTLNDGAIFTSNYSHRYVIIEENYFFQNYGTTIFGIGLEYTSISCNSFLDNTGIVIQLENFPSSGNISYNVIEGNSSANNLINIENTTANYTIGPIIFSNNLLRDNIADGSCLSIRPEMDDYQLMQILDNQFSFNEASNTILVDPNQPYPGNFNFLNMKRNSFINPLVQYDLYNNIPYGCSDLYVDSNYWGSISLAHIDSVIYDYFDFANQSVVYYLPILTSSTFIYPSCIISIPTGVISSKVPDFTALLYPNPASSHFAIHFNKLINNGLMVITNMLGEKIYQQVISNSMLEEINTSDFPNGFYVVNVSDELQQFTGRLIVESSK